MTNAPNNKKDLLPQPPAVEDAVGYGKPPKGHQFKPGHSGNPKGRPRRDTSIATALNKVLSDTVRLQVNGSAKLVPTGEAILLAQVHKAVRGDTRAAKFLFETAADYGVKAEPLPRTELVIRFVEPDPAKFAEAERKWEEANAIQPPPGGPRKSP